MVHFARVLLRPKCFTFSLGYRLTQWGIFNCFYNFDYLKSYSKQKKEPVSTSAAEIWENRNKEILREYYINKEAAAKNKAAVRGEHGLGVDYREVRP